jgi:hypothetical protein
MAYEPQNKASTPRERKPLSPPGKPGTFEEARQVMFEKYGNALRELAKYDTKDQK